MCMTFAPTNHHLCLLEAWINPKLQTLYCYQLGAFSLLQRQTHWLSHQGHNGVCHYAPLNWTKIPAGKEAAKRYVKDLKKSPKQGLHKDPADNQRSSNCNSEEQMLLFNDLLGFFLAPFPARRLKLD